MSHENPLVSVVVPVYNRGELIVDALESVRMQTYRPIELVVADDGSTDDLHARLLKWMDEHKNDAGFSVQYIHQENQGANAARNLGIQHSQGEFVAFIDSDDRWLPSKLEKQIPLFSTDAEIGGVYCGLGWVDLVSREQELDEGRLYPEGWLLKELLVHDITAGTSCYVIKRESFNKVGFFDVNLPARQDWDMWIRLSSKYKIACIHEVLVYGGKHPGQRISTNLEGSINAQLRIFEKYAPLRSQFPFSVRQSAESALYKRLGRIYFHHHISKRKAMRMYLKAIFTWPFDFDSYAALAGMLLPGGLRRNMHILWNKIFGKTPLAIRSF
jgi:glycosyltransferase involved in cell wall biosynthesis